MVGQSNVSDDTPSGGLNITVGAQLSTVIETSTRDVRTEVDDAGFFVEFETGDRAEAVADRAEELREEARDLRAEYREITEAFDAGELSREEYARRIATLHDRAAGLRTSLRRLESRAADLAPATRERIGVNRTAVQQVVDGLDDVSGAGPRALLAHFTGRAHGEIEVRVENGIRIEAESEDGERSREIRRPGDDSLAITIGQEAALETARGVLSTEAGNWTLVEASIHEDDGEHRFEFELGTANLTGETEVRVDGSSGDVVRIEEELEPRDDGDQQDDDDRADDSDEDDRDDDSDGDREEDERDADDVDDGTGDEENDSDVEDDEGTGDPLVRNESDGLTLSVVEGSAGRGETVTISVTVEGNRTADVPVEVNGEVAGTTDAEGTLTVTLPDAEDVRISAESGDHDGELRFEFEDEADGG